MKITIYELLGLLKDGKAPKKIKYGHVIYNKISDSDNYKAEDCVDLYLFDYEFFETSRLNDEVEILDEEDEFIDIEELTSSPEHYIENAINDLIKNQKLIINKLKEEGK